MQLSPYIRFAIDQRLAGTWSMHERIIFDYELLYVKEGEVLITVEDDRYLARPGDIFLFRPGRRHSMRALSPGGFRQPHLHFDLVYGEDSGQVFISFKNYQQMFGLSPIHYHQFCRLEKAKNIVLHTNLSFSQIADALRFESLSTFTRAFTKQFGQPPSAFRRRLGEASWQE